MYEGFSLRIAYQGDAKQKNKKSTWSLEQLSTGKKIISNWHSDGFATGKAENISTAAVWLLSWVLLQPLFAWNLDSHRKVDKSDQKK